MIEFLILFLGVYGALAAPHASHENDDLHLDNNTEVIDGQLPGTENLNEKALPISRLFATESSNLPARNNLAERSQIPQKLPGTLNLAEKRIPDVVRRDCCSCLKSTEKKEM